jgi:hypothetical protein
MCETLCYVACNNFEPLLCPLMSLCSIVSYVCLYMLLMNACDEWCMSLCQYDLFRKTGLSGFTNVPVFLDVLRNRMFWFAKPECLILVDGTYAFLAFIFCESPIICIT